MPRKTRHGPAAWIAAGLRLLAETGEQSVGIEPIARRLGATKGSFYHHFADRPALLVAMLEHWETRATAGLIGRIEAAGGSTESRLWALTETVIREGAASPEPAIRLWARSDETARAALARVDSARLDWLTGLFAALDTDAGVRTGPRDGTDPAIRAHLLYTALIGEHALGERPAIDGRLDRAKRILAQLAA